MKNITILLLTSITLLVSCGEKPNLEGHWHVYYGEEREPSPYFWDIRNDTLHYLIQEEFVGPDSFKISRHNIEITLPGWKKEVYDYEYFGDSCFFYQNDTLKLVLQKRHNCKLYEHWIEPKVHMNPPSFLRNEVETFGEDDSLLAYTTSYIWIGTPIDSSKKNFVQLNDMVTGLDRIPGFFSEDTKSVHLLIQDTISMSKIDKVLMKIRESLVHRVYFVFDIVESNDVLGRISKTLYDIDNELDYSPKYLESKFPPFLSPQKLSIIEDIELPALKLHLKNNQLYLSEKEIDNQKLKSTLKKYFQDEHENKKRIPKLIFEWDTASVFDSYAKALVLIDNAIKNYQKETSKDYLLKDYEQLTEEELKLIKKLFPVKLVEISPADRYAIDKKNGDKL